MGGIILTPELKSRVIELKTLDPKSTQTVIAQAAGKEFDVRISKHHVGRILKEALEHGPIDPRQTGSKPTLQVETAIIDLSEELGEVAEGRVPQPISPDQLPKWPELEEIMELWMAKVAHAMQQEEPVSEVNLKAEAVKQAQGMGLSGFLSGSGWLRGFTKRMDAKALKEQKAAPAVLRELPSKRQLSNLPAKDSEAAHPILNTPAPDPVPDNGNQEAKGKPCSAKGSKRRRKAEDSDWLPATLLGPTEEVKKAKTTSRTSKLNLRLGSMDVGPETSRSQSNPVAARKARGKLKLEQSEKSSSVRPGSEQPELTRRTSGRERRGPDKYHDEPRDAYLQRDKALQDAKAEKMALIAMMNDAPPTDVKQAAAKAQIDLHKAVSKEEKPKSLATEIFDQTEGPTDTAPQASTPVAKQKKQRGRPRPKDNSLAVEKPQTKRAKPAKPKPLPAPDHEQDSEQPNSYQPPRRGRPKRSPVIRQQVVCSSPSASFSKGISTDQDVTLAARKRMLRAKDREAALLPPQPSSTMDEKEASKQKAKAKKFKLQAMQKLSQEISDSGTERSRPRIPPKHVPAAPQATDTRDAREASPVSQIASSPRQTQITQGVEVTSPLPSNHRMSNPAVPSDTGATDPATDAALQQTADSPVQPVASAKVPSKPVQQAEAQAAKPLPPLHPLAESQINHILSRLLQGTHKPSIDDLQPAFTHAQIELERQCRAKVKSCLCQVEEINRSRAAERSNALRASLQRSQQLEAMSAVRSKRLQDRQSKMNEVYLEVERLKARNAELKERKRVFLADDDLEFKARYAAMEARLHAIKKRKQQAEAPRPIQPSLSAPMNDVAHQRATPNGPPASALKQPRQSSQFSALPEFLNRPTASRDLGAAAKQGRTSDEVRAEAQEAGLKAMGFVTVSKEARQKALQQQPSQSIPASSQAAMQKPLQHQTSQSVPASSQSAMHKPLQQQTSQSIPVSSQPARQKSTPSNAQLKDAPNGHSASSPHILATAKQTPAAKALSERTGSQARLLGSPRPVLTPSRLALLKAGPLGSTPTNSQASPAHLLPVARASPAHPLPVLRENGTASIQGDDVSASRPDELAGPAVIEEPHHPEFTDADLPALWTHTSAFQAHKKVTDQYISRRRAAERYKGNCAIKGRALNGYTSRCGGAIDSDTGAVAVGCGTALADVHYICYSCSDFDAAPGSQARDSHMLPAQEEHALDYCADCVRLAHYRCPNAHCLSREPVSHDRLEPQDYLQDTKGVRPFAWQSAEAVKDWNGEGIAERQAEGLREYMKTLPESCLQHKSADSPMYIVDAQTNDEHWVYKNGLADGVPVLVTGADQYFNNTPFSADSMMRLAKGDMSLNAKVKSQFLGEDGGTAPSANCTIEDFFMPMLKKPSGLKVDQKEPAGHVGFKLPDFGIKPKAQTKAFWDGLRAMGLGDICCGDSPHNIATCLRSEHQDAVNGTQVPDLGPKFYIARPILTKITKKRTGADLKYSGFTFTPLHCDLADAVNYSCWGESATWHIFHRKDRPKLLEFLREHHGMSNREDATEGRSGEDMLWNPHNHSLLQDKDFDILRDKYGVKPWKFTQRSGEIVVIPAGCAHQVKNDGGGPNIKIAQDFIAPQSALVCLELMDEMRKAKQEDKLQAALTLRFAGAEAYSKRYIGEAILEQACPPTC